MQRTIPVALLVLIAAGAGLWLGRQSAPHTPDSAAAPNAEREILYWVAPMDPSFRRDGPGKSPMGMDLVPVYADEAERSAGIVAIDPVIVNNMGVRSVAATTESLPRRIETVGYVNYDEETVQHVHTRVEGWIESLAVTSTGDAVSKGQFLFELYSPTLVNAQQEFLAAMAGSNASLKSASRERLVALGMTEAEVERLGRERVVQQRVRYFAADDGVVAHLGVREGVYVTPETEVLSVANLDTVWVFAEVFERQADWVEPGQAAVVTIDYRPGVNFAGTVDYVYPELDPVSRTLRVRLRFDNDREVLRPNMFTRVQISGRETGPIVNIPREAVIRGGRGNRVVVDLGDGRFQSRRVLVGIESGDRVAIRRGIAAGDRVVVSGQFLIDSESNIDSALDRLSSGPTDGAASEHDHGSKMQ